MNVHPRDEDSRSRSNWQFPFQVTWPNRVSRCFCYAVSKLNRVVGICATCDQQPASGDEDCARVPETVQMTSTTSSNGFPLLGIPIELCPRALPCSLSLMQVHAAVCIHQILSTFRKRARP